MSLRSQLVLAATLVSALGSVTAPAEAFDTLSQDQTLAGSDSRCYDSATDVDGFVAAVASPDTGTIETFSYDLSAEQWQAGPTSTPTAVKQERGSRKEAAGKRLTSAYRDAERRPTQKRGCQVHTARKEAAKCVPLGKKRDPPAERRRSRGLTRGSDFF